MNRFLATLLVCSFAAGSAAESVARKSAVRFEDTQRALRYLLAASEITIPRSSSCQGSFGYPPPPHIKDLVSMELASMSGGENGVRGKCTAKSGTQCSVSFSHSSGEDVSSAEIDFQVRNERLVPGSLYCVLSP